MSNYKRLGSINLKWIISLVLIVLLSVAVVFAFVKIDNMETTKTIGGNSFNYSIGLINDETGEYEQGTSSIYTKNYFNVDGLTIEVDEDSTVSYKVCFYDEDQNFISMTDSLTENFDGSTTPENAEFFRIMITPTNDVEVNWTEIGLYSNMITVSVSK